MMEMENTTGAKPSTRKKPIRNELLPSTKVISHGDNAPRTGKIQRSVSARMILVEKPGDQ